jgi:hypothetical protein
MTNHPKFTASHDSAGYEGAREIRKPLKNPIPAHRSEEIRRGSPITDAERAAYDEYREAMTKLRQKAGRAGARKRWSR